MRKDILDLLIRALDPDLPDPSAADWHKLDLGPTVYIRRISWHVTEKEYLEMTSDILQKVREKSEDCCW